MEQVFGWGKSLRVTSSALTKKWLETLFILGFLFVAFPWFSFLESAVDLGNSNGGITLRAPLGTDNLGRNLLYRISYSIYHTIIPIWGVVLGTCLLGWMIGCFFYSLRQKKSWSPLVRCVELILVIFLVLPVTLSCFYWSVLYGTGIQSVIVALGIVCFSKSYYFVFIKLKKDENIGYWIANKVNGGTAFYRAVHYGVFSHWRRELARDLTMYLNIAITIEVSLSYLGFGVQEPQPSIGNILSSHIGGIFGPGYRIVLFVIVAYGFLSILPGSLCNLLLGSCRSKNHQTHRL